jgi:hypothetical protein
LAEKDHSCKIAGDTEEAYWRSDRLEKRRTIKEAWARYVEPSVGGAKVINLRKKGNKK